MGWVLLFSDITLSEPQVERLRQINRRPGVNRFRFWYDRDRASRAGTGPPPPAGGVGHRGRRVRLGGGTPLPCWPTGVDSGGDY